MKLQSQSHIHPWNLFNKSYSPKLFAVILLVVSLEVIESGFLVKTLPGFVGDLPFTLETGYIGVGESNDVQFFYYFIESEGNPKDDPLILWLTGGPGCSALSGLFYEIGPLTINYENSTLEKAILEIKPHSWTKVANIIFLDQPAGSGFSYAGRTPKGYITNDTLSAMHTYQFLRKWLMDHPKFLKNPFYLAGESYSGIVVPLVVDEIYNGIGVREWPQINIKGYVLGNPATDSSGYNSRIPYAHQMALLSDAIYKSAKENCHGEYVNVDPNNSLCIRDLEVVEKCLERINTVHILEPSCEPSTPLKSNMLGRSMRSLDKAFVDAWPLPQFQMHWCRNKYYIYSSTWANSRDVREALHVREEINDIEWIRCNDSLRQYTYTHNVPDVVGYHRRFTDKNCRALVYSGDHDMMVPYISTLNWIESLNLSVESDWRPWFVNEQVTGYTMKYSKNDYSLTYATIKGGGHTAPEYKPKECLNMLKRWLAYNPL